jgi:hypothetical protein
MHESAGVHNSGTQALSESDVPPLFGIDIRSPRAAERKRILNSSRRRVHSFLSRHCRKVQASVWNVTTTIRKGHFLYVHDFAEVVDR